MTTGLNFWIHGSDRARGLLLGFQTSFRPVSDPLGLLWTRDGIGRQAQTLAQSAILLRNIWLQTEHLAGSSRAIAHFKPILSDLLAKLNIACLLHSPKYLEASYILACSANTWRGAIASHWRHVWSATACPQAAATVFTLRPLANQYCFSLQTVPLNLSWALQAKGKGCILRGARTGHN